MKEGRRFTPEEIGLDAYVADLKDRIRNMQSTLDGRLASKAVLDRYKVKIEEYTKELETLTPKLRLVEKKTGTEE